MEKALRARRWDDEDFWFRRYFTTVDVASATLFAAIISGVLQATDITDAGLQMQPAMRWLSIGGACAIFVPACHWLRAVQPSVEWRRAVGS